MHTYMSMLQSTQPAHTEDQITVLEAADQHPDATPSELASKIDEEHLTTQYVVSILDGFHLPEDHDKPLSESATRLEGRADGGDEIEIRESDLDELSDTHFACALCDYTSDTPKGVRVHIQRSNDSKHKGRKGSEPHLIVPRGENAQALQRLNDRSGDTGTVTDEHFRVLWYFHRNPESTLKDAERDLGMSESVLSRRLKDVGIVGDQGTMPADRADMIRDALADAGITFVDTPDDAEDSGSEEVEAEGDLPGDFETFAGTDPEDMNVVDLEFGSSIENTEVGAWYSGYVNGVETYGVFVTVAKGPSASDLSGLAHKSDIPALYVPSDYEVGDDVVVERLPNGDDTKLSLRMVTDPEGDFIVDGPLVDPQISVSASESAPDHEATEDTDARSEPSAASDEDVASAVGAVAVTDGATSAEEAPSEPSRVQADPEVTESLEELQEAVSVLQRALFDAGGEAEDERADAFHHLHRRHDVLQDTLGVAEGGADSGKLDTLMQQLHAIEAAVTNRDSRDPEKPFTLHLSAEDMKKLVREGPEDVADLALDALAEGAGP